MVYNFLFGKKGKLYIVYTGLKNGLIKEPSLKYILVIISVLSIILHFYEKDFSKKSILIFSLILIFITELINTSIEATVDRIGLEQNILSGYAKDLSSSAVFITVLLSIYLHIIYYYSLKYN